MTDLIERLRLRLLLWVLKHLERPLEGGQESDGAGRAAPEASGNNRTRLQFSIVPGVQLVSRQLDLDRAMQNAIAQGIVKVDEQVSVCRHEPLASTG